MTEDGDSASVNIRLRDDDTCIIYHASFCVMPEDDWRGGGGGTLEGGGGVYLGVWKTIGGGVCVPWCTVLVSSPGVFASWIWSSWFHPTPDYCTEQMTTTAIHADSMYMYL